MGRLIDADEAIEKQWYGNSNPILYRQYAVQVLKNCPTVDAVPVVHGKWMLLDDCSNAGVYCTVCYKKIYLEGFARKVRANYCPNCGAKMDLEE